MKTYARLDNNQLVVELIEIEDDQKISEMFHPSLIWVECDASVEVGNLHDDGKFSVPPPDLAALWAAYRADAQAALDKSDVTILRCMEAAVTVPAAWVTYRKALRVIVSAASGDGSAALPKRPSFPAGT